MQFMGLSAVSASMREAIARVRPHLVATATFSALVNLLYLAPTIYMLQVYDRVVPSRSVETLLLVTAIMLFALATLSILDRLRSRLLVRAGIEFDLALGATILDATFARPDLPEARQALRSFDNLRGVLSGTPILALFDLPWIPIYVLVCFLVHPVIGLIALLGICGLPALAWLNGRATRDKLNEARVTANASYRFQESLISSADAVRALGLRRALVRRQGGLRQVLVAQQTEAGFAGGAFFTATKFIRLALQSLALGAGAWLAIGGSMSAGAIFAASFLIARALQPVEQLIGTARQIADARADFSAIDKLLAAIASTDLPTELPAPRGRIDLEDVTVLNEQRDGAILQGISLSISPGEAVAIVGPSGAGKSTLMRVIAGATAADRGLVRFDGAPAGHYEPERLARYIGYLPQDSVLFGGTVAENISRFSKDLGEDAAAVDAKVVAAAETVRAGDLIKRLNGGFDHRVAVGGRNLSAGQTQRVALARAFYDAPPILVLDEPNAHLDGEGDAALLGAIAAAKARGVTVLIVSHKLNVLPAVDKILVLRDGRSEMFGPRDQVLAKIMPPQQVPAPAKQGAGQTAGNVS